MPRASQLTFSNLHELHYVVNRMLRQIVAYERCQSWQKVVFAYRHMFSLIGRDALPEDYEPPASYSLLLYELHCHMGVAQQHLGEHKKAAIEFSRAIRTVAQPKNGCEAGCHRNTCFMSPVLARRAFAYCMIGDLDSAMTDAEKAVVLDNNNPDALCVRAMVRVTRDEEPQALQDVNRALTLQPSHVCALLLQGSLSKPLLWFEDAKGKDMIDNIFHEKAVALEPDSVQYLDLVSFVHPNILRFYERYLHSLNISHSVITIDLTPDKPSLKQIEKNTELYKPASRSGKRALPWEVQQSRHPFVCGMTVPKEYNKTSSIRRRHYGDAVRSKTTLDREDTEHAYQEKINPPSRGQAFKSVILPSRRSVGRSVSAPPLRLESGIPTGSGTQLPFGLLERMQTLYCDSMRTLNSKKSRLSRTKSIIIEPPEKFIIPIFQPVNVKNAPRMYYRPWKGDKLPSTILPKKSSPPAFY